MKPRFGYRFEKAKRLPENYTVLSNHATDYDMLFLCPECGMSDSVHAQGDTVCCDGCGHTLRYDAYGMLSGGRFRTLREISDRQKEQVLAAIAGALPMRRMQRH